jgi:hypothetical protein
MTKAEENLLIEQVAGAFRPRVGEELTYHSAWHDHDAAARVRAFDLSTVLRPIEAALDVDGLSTTARAVLARIPETL